MSPRVIRVAALLVAAAFSLWHLLPDGLSERDALLGPGRAAGASAPNDILYSQSPNSTGGLLRSSVLVSGRSAGDRWVWDAFTLAADSGISDIHWTGGYDPASAGSGGPVVRFTVAIYASSKLVDEPDLSGPLVLYEVEGNAGQATGQVLGGVQMYGYSFALPQSFQAVGGTKYWVQIEAFQSGDLPDWGITAGTGGDGFYFRRVGGSINVYQRVSGDAAFTVYGSAESGNRLYLPNLARG